MTDPSAETRELSNPGSGPPQGPVWVLLPLILGEYGQNEADRRNILLERDDYRRQ